MTNVCPRCGGTVGWEEDQNGPRFFCRICGWQLDLLQPPPETLAMLKKVASHPSNSNHKRLAGPWSNTHNLHDRLDGRRHRERQ
jgi:endogenous inhibitor of DNA gyrase (YacG/DUF329 family)